MRNCLLIASMTILTCAAAQAQQFQAQGVDLLSHLSLTDLGVPAGGNGNDVWGYVSPSGREYAVVGLYDRCSFVEVTNPAAPVIRAVIPHTGSLWAGLKVYNHAVQRGLFIRNMGDRIAICPPLIINETELADLFDRLRQSLDAALAELKAEGKFKG